MDKWLSKYVDAVILMNLKERTDRLEETKR